MTYALALSIAAKALTLVAWIILAVMASVMAGVGLEQRKDGLVWGAVGICALIFARAVVWLLS